MGQDVEVQRDQVTGSETQRAWDGFPTTSEWVPRASPGAGCRGHLPGRTWNMRGMGRNTVRKAVSFEAKRGRDGDPEMEKWQVV